MNEPGERIAKVIARAGLCSRREAEHWIKAGRVEVDGKVITSPALNVTSAEKILVDGRLLKGKEPTRVWLYHKPRGLVTTHKDPQGRPTVFEHLPPELPRVISVGRLDLDSEGLLLLTNDGDLAREWMLPSQGWVRKYRVRVHGRVDEKKLASLKNGITIPDPRTGEPTRYGSIRAIMEKKGMTNSWLMLELAEGKNREIRNVCAYLGLEVNRLIRIAYGAFELGDLEIGEVREN